MGTQQSTLSARSLALAALLAFLGIALPCRAQCYMRLIDHVSAPAGANRGFGFPIVLSRDGSTMLVGRAAPTLPSDMFVLTSTADGWVPQSTTLRTAAGPFSGLTPIDDFGSAGALSADASTALVSAPSMNTTGQVFVFTHAPTGWSLQAPPLVPANTTSQVVFGCACALSADGNTALIGAPQARTNGQLTGAAYVFTRSGAAWTQQGGPLPAINPLQAQMGCAVALSADGNTAAVGGIAYGTTGAVFVFTRSGTTWTEQGAALVPAGGVGSQLYFGFSLGLSDDGNTMAVGAIYDQNQSGAVYLFTRTGSAWTQRSRLTDTPAGWLGHRLGLSTDGNTLLVAASNGNKAFVYSRSGNAWTRRGQPILAPPGALQYFGLDVALSADGHTGFIGSGIPSFNAFQPTLGAVFRFNLCAPTACASDFNTSGSLSVYDIFDFLTAWFALDPRANFNGVDGINEIDIFDFLNAWFVGC